MDFYTEQSNSHKEHHSEKRKEIKTRIAEISNEMNKTTLINKDLFHHADAIHNIIKMGRADSLKEAINIVLDEERKSQEELIRQEEAARQEAILKQQAADTRAHFKEMERAAQNQAAAAQAQARAAQMQNDLTQKQYNDAKREAQRRCAFCANYDKCSFEIRGKTINCNAFRPR